ncbi:DUF1778 domain-containing protein [Pontibacter sp. G13]|uniref:type II toxin-antitoxin system TacA family antitoxin n=1 Tax=Pontibacter sp. G13 TaxID=3074898 RepID=UPI00288B8D96|nr:DUF1778 domain-containing protein [Pontibacter sp. G13]WNJ17209.1 DUF1778 domain-containing protein [Pontibacter sp. G13]
MKPEKTRFDARLTVEQKELFEKAAVLGGFRNLSDFVIQVAQEKAKEIIEEREQIKLSEEDAVIFYDSLENPPEPNQKLQEALAHYKKLLSE